MPNGESLEKVDSLKYFEGVLTNHFPMSDIHLLKKPMNTAIQQFYYQKRVLSVRSKYYISIHF